MGKPPPTAAASGGWQPLQQIEAWDLVLPLNSLSRGSCAPDCDTGQALGQQQGGCLCGLHGLDNLVAFRLGEPQALQLGAGQVCRFCAAASRSHCRLLSQGHLLANHDAGLADAGARSWSLQPRRPRWKPNSSKVTLDAACPKMRLQHWAAYCRCNKLVMKGKSLQLLAEQAFARLSHEGAWEKCATEGVTDKWLKVILQVHITPSFESSSSTMCGFPMGQVKLSWLLHLVTLFKKFSKL